jgi:hypothetical protein
MPTLAKITVPRRQSIQPKYRDNLTTRTELVTAREPLHNLQTAALVTLSTQGGDL